jgi:hypothetical protein
MVVVVVCAVTAVAFWKSCSLVPGLHLDVKLTSEFIASIPTVRSAGMGRLELATADATETFSRSQVTESWGIYLGTTYVEMHVPVTYRYQLNLAEPWQLYVDQDVCIVKAPKIRPSLPPAIHTDGIERLSENGWARFNKEEEMENLEKDVTPTLTQYAGDPRHIKLVREECRKTVANFVKAFLLEKAGPAARKFDRIVVIFADEPFQSVETLPATIEMRPK